LFKAHVAISYD